MMLLLLPALLLISLSVMYWHLLLLTVSILPTFPPFLNLSLSLTVNHVVFACPLPSLFTLIAFFSFIFLY